MDFRARRAPGHGRGRGRGRGREGQSYMERRVIHNRGVSRPWPEHEARRPQSHGVRQRNWDREQGKDGNYQPREINWYRKLRSLKEDTPANIIISLSNTTWGLERLLCGEGGRLNAGIVQLLLEVFGKMVESDEAAVSLTCVLLMIVDNDFDKYINDFIYGLRMQSGGTDEREKARNHLRNAMKLARTLLIVIPKRSEKKVSMMMCIFEAVINGLGGMPSLQTICDDIKLMLEQLGESFKKKKQQYAERKRESNAMIRHHLQPPPDDFREIPIFPQLCDIQANAEPFIRCNLTDRAYQDIDHYLDVQFRLLREDFIRPLRDGIAEIRDFGDQNEKSYRFENVKVYQDVKALFVKPDLRGIHHKMQFNVDKFKHVRWENSKRLLYGNLVCFSSDLFQNEVIFAVVSDRNPQDLQNGVVTVTFVYEENKEEFEDELSDEADDDELLGAAGGPNQQRRFCMSRASIDFKKVYIMAETDAYFEAYRHVLRGLRDTKDLPLERYIVHCSEDMHAPRYLRPATSGRIRYNLSSITKKDGRVDVLGGNWPSPEELHLNRSQAEALKLALTNELAVIQGPPGTGKTHVGLKVMRILIENKRAWSQVQDPRNREHCPILVVCYTNHALDQFLEGIAEFASEDNVIIRVGGRCQSEATKKFSLGEIRQKKRSRNGKRNKAIWEIKNEMKNLEAELLKKANVIEASMRCFPRLDALHVSQHLYQQFTASNALSYPGKGNPDEAVLMWLRLPLPGRKRNYKDAYLDLHENVRAHLHAWGFNEIEIGRSYYESGQYDVPSLAQFIIDHRIEWARQDFESNMSLTGDDYVEEAADVAHRNRMLETDEPRDASGRTNKEKEMKDLLYKISALTFEELDASASRVDEDGFQKYKRKRTKPSTEYSKQINTGTTMSAAEERNIQNIYALSDKERWRLYRTWVNRLRDQLRVIPDGKITLYNQYARRLEELRQMEDAEILQNADVVAVTTTGAAKYRNLIYKLKTKIVVIEEAAEVLEAHIITSMPKSTQHLILIGDHQQLRPSPTVYELAKKYNLETSLFERLIKVGIPHVTLNIQHRMRPEIADLIRPRIYENLQDHESVLNRDQISGIQKSMFFITHDVHEENLKDGKSKQNQHEVDFLVALCDYLLKQGYKPDQITILTMYSGQLFAIHKKMKEQLRQGVRATAVDNFQGEENDIILLSLVRSNDQASIGFLATENRICVSLSRAKLGLYCIGNMDILAKKCGMWRQLKEHLEKTDSIGDSLVLQCKNHPETFTLVQTASDFKKVPEGGCQRNCEERLKCGHVCPRPCHPLDHSDYKCLKSCTKELDCGHKCRGICSYKCPDCKELVERTLPCGHEQEDFCYLSVERIFCRTRVEADLPCGHKAEVKCWELGKVDQTYCREKCNELLACSHACRGSCVECFQGRLHVPCQYQRSQKLSCGHTCESKCLIPPLCEKSCQTGCSHSVCKRKCGEPCIPCTEKCNWECIHMKCTKLCGDPCDRGPCNEPCQKILKCKHPCIGFCGEQCPVLCRVCHKDKVLDLISGNMDMIDTSRFVQLEDCGDIFVHTYLDEWMKQPAIPTNKMKACPRCNKIIRKSNRYRNILKKDIESANEDKKIRWGDVESAKERISQLTDEFGENIEKMHYKREAGRILEILKLNPPPPKQIDVLGKTLRMLQVLSDLKGERFKMSVDTSISERDLKVFDADLRTISKWVVYKRPQITDEEERRFKQELNRLKDILIYACLRAECGYKLGSRNIDVEPNFGNSLPELKSLLIDTFRPYDSSSASSVRKLFEIIHEKIPGLRQIMRVFASRHKPIKDYLGMRAAMEEIQYKVEDYSDVSAARKTLHRVPSFKEAFTSEKSPGSDPIKSVNDVELADDMLEWETGSLLSVEDRDADHPYDIPRDRVDEINSSESSSFELESD